jgi:mycothione reductase
MMKGYDAIVLGAGDVGLAVAFKAASQGFKVALIDKGLVGGTCVNTGCVPSKTLIHTADRVLEIREAKKLGIETPVIDIDFPAIMKRMRSAVTNGRTGILGALEDTENLDFFPVEGRFLDEHTVETANEQIRGKKIFIATGARPSIPSIPGIESVPFLTNENVLELEQRPESIIFIGGGYVGLEYAHFFSAIGTRVKLIHRHPNLLPFEDPEISALLAKRMETVAELCLETETVEVKPMGLGVMVLVKDIRGGNQKEMTAERLFVSTGRRSNADYLRVENAGLETDERHFIKVDDTLQTNKTHIWALGDAIGKAMFTHAGDREAELAWHNATHKRKHRMDFETVPHAVFTYPQIASVGMTETQARKDHAILVGKASYSDTVMGEAMGEEEGFAKAIVEKGTGRILGFHIIGPQASILIQEVVNAVILKQTTETITGCMHIFPALSNLITETLDNLA